MPGLVKNRSEVRPPAVAGMFYPSDKLELERLCRDLLSRAGEYVAGFSAGKVFGIVSPHAGYPYSGFTAAHGYSLLHEGQFKCVIIISPSHREYFDGVSVYPGVAYSTPLGEVEVDRDLRETLLSTVPPGLLTESILGHRSEHALEVQLPFLQVQLKNFTLLPIVMGDQKPEYCRALGDGLARIVRDQNILVVASSDLSHYHDYDTANEMDGICIEHFKALDSDKLLDDIHLGRCEACGGGPIASSLAAAKALGFRHGESLYHCNSGDTTGDKSAVVGYLSALIS